VKYAEQK